MGECLLPVRKGGNGGIGQTMVISKTHQGTDAPLNFPLQVGYYQDLVEGAAFSSVSLKQNGAAVAVTRSIVDRDKIQLDGEDLKEFTTYDFEVPVGAVRDVLGNVLKGVYQYSFTTGESPAYVVTPQATKAAFDMIIASINANGGTIYFTEGEFRGLFPIEITHSDVTLQGEGVNTKIICDTPNSGSTVGVIEVKGTSAVHITNVTICDMVIDGDYSSDIANRNYDGISIHYMDFSDVKDVVIQNNYNLGIEILVSNNNAIIGNTVQNVINWGVFMSGSNNNTFTGNTVQNNNNNGIRLDYLSNNNTITGNIVQNNSGGIHLYDSSNNTITGNKYTSIYISGTSTGNLNAATHNQQIA